MANDPLLQAAADLKKELADVESPELQEHMAEIMKLILGCIEPIELKKKN